MSLQCEPLLLAARIVTSIPPIGLLGIGPFLLQGAKSWIGWVQILMLVGMIVIAVVAMTTAFSTVTNAATNLTTDATDIAGAAKDAGVVVSTFATFAVLYGVCSLGMFVFWIIAMVHVWSSRCVNGELLGSKLGGKRQ